MTRRDLFNAAAAAVAAGRFARADAIPNPKGKRGMGGAPTAFSAHNAPPGGAVAGGGRGRGAGRPFSEEFFDYCHSLGLGGAEMGAPPMEPEAIAKFRDKVQSYNMFVLFDIPLPRTDADLDRFDAQVKAAAAVGAYGLHSAMTQRRYEEFSTLAEYRTSFATNQAIVARAEPVLRKHKVRLALENHKGWRAVEQAEWMKRLGSEFVGVHLDFGNNISFLEDPMFTLETLKPWIFSAHIKDMAVQKYEKGFLLSEVPMGEGFLDLRKMVDVLRAQNPDMPMDLEMITRDPLEVPVYTDKYWATFQDIPGQQMARMMELIEKNPPKKPLPTIKGLDLAARKKLEEEYNLACIRYAREKLGL